MQQHTVFPARKITMNYTQLTQEARYHIQDLSCHHTIIEWWHTDLRQNAQSRRYRKRLSIVEQKFRIGDG